MPEGRPPTLWGGLRALAVRSGLHALAARMPDAAGKTALFGVERRCPLCAAVHRPAPGALPLCPDCLAALPLRGRGFCPHCGELAAWPELPPAPCARCLLSPPPWKTLYFYDAHEGLLRQLLIRLKFGGQTHLGALLGGLLARHPALAGFAPNPVVEAAAQPASHPAPEEAPDLIAPVPLHARRLAERGYNQSLLLARPLARHLGLPLGPGLLTRARKTAPQTGSSREERRNNVRRAFCAHADARGRHILLIDDTMTTGATLAEAARCLLEAGARRVDAAVVSRTPLHAHWA